MAALFPSTSISSILVVDDDEVIRLFLRQFLEGELFNVIEAENGESALELIATNSFDLILLDIAMPGLDGPSVCKKIKNTLEFPPPVLMITALEDDDSVDRSFDAGAIDYIRKPIHWPVLKNRIRYILEAHKSQADLERVSENYEMILDTAANGICGVDKKKQINYINPAASRMLGYDTGEVLGRPYREIFCVSMPNSDSFDVDCCPFFEIDAPKNPFQYDELQIKRKKGDVFSADCKATPIFNGPDVVGGVMVFEDVTERLQAQNIIRYMADHDSLTNLPNRNYFHKRLPQAISLAERHNRMLCLLFIDLDRFKPVNDTYGHAIGDMVLVQVANRLSKMLRTSDSICRLGGDEFVILLESSGNIKGCEMVAAKAIKSLNEPIEVDDHVCYIGASIGISVFPEDCSNAETMLRHADIAMYQAKKKGRNCFYLFNELKDNEVLISGQLP